MKNYVIKLNDRIPEYKNFKAKWSLYLLTYLLCVTFCLGFTAKHLITQWVISGASIKLKEAHAAMAPVRKLNEENYALKKNYEELVNSLGSDNKPVVVKIINDGSAKSKALFKARKEWGDGELFAFEQLIIHESNFRPDAQNPTSTAFGMFQFLDSTWNGYKCEKTEEIDHQIDCGIKYIKQRYQNPTNAWKAWLSRSPHWY